MKLPATPTRRAFLAVGASVLVPVAGCLGGGPDASGPEEHAYTMTITRPGETLELRIEPTPDVADVIQMHVGDTAEFTVLNRADDPVGFHNHATDSEITIEPGAERTVAFDATEAMVGRQEIEGWVVEDGTGSEDHGGHGDATTLVVIEVRPRGS